jgi:hypothetical protein
MVRPLNQNEQITAWKLNILQSALVLNMEAMKGTTLYSKKVTDALRQLDTFNQTKLSKIYNSEAGAEVADETMMGLDVVDFLLEAAVAVGIQPIPVQERFERELCDLLIRYGVKSALPI